MPDFAGRIMKLDPINSDAITSVGDYLGDKELKYIGMVIGIDGCVYGIPFQSNFIVKYDPVNDTTSFIGKKLRQDSLECNGSGVLGRDGCIYARALNVGKVLKIDTTNNYHSFVKDIIAIANPRYSDEGRWGDAVLGVDGCISWPPLRANRITMVGNNFEIDLSQKWGGGSLTSDGVIYCIPSNAKRILCIDLFKEFMSSVKKNMENHPEQLGCLFQSSNDSIPDKTNFDCAVVKFGHEKVLKVIDECMPPVDQMCAAKNLYPFLIAASCKRSDVSVIYQLSRQALPSLVDCVKYDVDRPLKSSSRFFAFWKRVGSTLLKFLGTFYMMSKK